MSQDDDIERLAVSFLKINLTETSAVASVSKVSILKQIPKLIHLMVLMLPVIVPINILFVSIILMNFKGFVYLAFLIASYIVRRSIYALVGAFSSNDDTDATDSKGYHCGLSTFILSFTMSYLCVPMLILRNVNVMILAVMLFLILVDFFYKSSHLCSLSLETVMNLFLGAFLGFGICFLLYIGGSSSYLFFSEVSSKEYCSVPQKQKFKCNVYKNGELVKA